MLGTPVRYAKTDKSIEILFGCGLVEPFDGAPIRHRNRHFFGGGGMPGDRYAKSDSQLHKGSMRRCVLLATITVVTCSVSDKASCDVGQHLIASTKFTTII